MMTPGVGHWSPGCPHYHSEGTVTVKWGTAEMPIPPLKKGRGRPTGTTNRAYRIYLTILYGRHDWIQRTPHGTTQIAVGRACVFFQCKPSILKACLEQANSWGFLSYYKWSQGWFELRPEVPPGMCILLPTVTTIVASETAPTV